jgi:hypothetical protein
MSRLIPQHLSFARFHLRTPAFPAEMRTMDSGRSYTYYGIPVSRKDICVSFGTKRRKTMLFSELPQTEPP